MDNPNSKSLEFWEKIRHECFYCFFYNFNKDDYIFDDYENDDDDDLIK